ncbi:MAG: sigma 54-interacting transcriptional regulator [Bacteroidota bacterium]
MNPEEKIDLLLVEDSADDAELLVFELEQEGFLIDWQRVSSAEHFLQALQDREWDLVISDYSMQGFTGMDVLHLLRKFDPIIPFVLVSGAVGERVAIELMKEGGQDYVLKNNLVRLPTILRRELEESRIKKNANQNKVKLAESNERMRLIYDSTNDCMSLIKVSGDHMEIESVNDSFVQCHQKIGVDAEKEDYIGMLVPYFFGAKLEMKDERVYEMLDRIGECIRSQHAVEFIEELHFRNQTLYIENWITPIIKNGVCTHVLRVTHDVTIKINATQKLEEAYKQVESLKVKLEQENRYLKEELNLEYDFKSIIYQSEKFKKILKNIEDVAPLDTTVLISGEAGTGKELLARAVHDLSPRKKKPLVKVNCAALPRELIESELFGHEAGAFTGATQKKIGKFELAQDGSIFLDEIGELPIELQPKLLRVLQEGEFERIGGTQTIKLNVRIIAATNRDLQKAIKEGKFREDLYYRLHVFPIHVPPLRERTDDILPLFFFFIKKYSKKFSKNIDFIPDSIIHAFESYGWPGNVREMEHLVERALILSKDGYLPIDQFIGISKDLPQEQKKPVSEELWKIERDHILKILDKYKWKINGEKGAAKALGLKPSTLRDRMKKYHIFRPKPRQESSDILRP